MNIRDSISNGLMERDGIYHLENHGAFDYNDGDMVEMSLLDVLRNTCDVSTNSRELEGHAKNWVSRYHFSRSRSLAYQSLKITREASVLEVGSGSGSITRLLGERAGPVLAVEGSPRRAAMTHLRTRGQNNVSVICAAFENIKFRRKFDIIVCNGVLEYASLFMSGDEPEKKMVEMLACLLNPGGTLIIAIENKLGLRYFSSAREEHTGIAFDGLEGYARHPRGPRTYGRAELEILLRKKFASVEFLFPLPDYKFPRALVREHLLQDEDCSELFASTGSGQCGTSFQPMMHERLAWHQLGKNRQLASSANSFFVLAGQTSSALLEPSWRGDIYAINRSPGFEIRTRILAGTDGKIATQKAYMEQAPRAISPFVHRLDNSAWVAGESMHTAISRIFLDASSMESRERLHWLVSKWWEAIVARAQDCNNEEEIYGSVLDLNWDNSILRDGNVYFIDSEWAVEKNIPVQWLLYRTLSKFIDGESGYRHRWNRSFRNASKYKLLCALGVPLDIKFSLLKILHAIRLEREFQRMATGKCRNDFRVMIEDLVPFWLTSFWRKWTERLCLFGEKVSRNIRRALSMAA